MAQNKGLLFYYDWKLPFEILSGDDFKSLFLAMLDYSRDGTPPPEFEGAAKITAAFVFPTIDRAKEAAEAGRRGGLKSKKMREENLSPAEKGMQGGTEGTTESSATTIRYNTNTDTNNYTIQQTPSGNRRRTPPMRRLIESLICTPNSVPLCVRYAAVPTNAGKPSEN